MRSVSYTFVHRHRGTAMSYVSKYFQPEEFICHCGCGRGGVVDELLMELDDIREYFGAPVYIDCGRRCVEHNRAVGGAPDSQHLIGYAADIRIQGHAPGVVQAYLHNAYEGRYGIGSYPTFTHFDVRERGPARWAKN